MGDMLLSRTQAAKELDCHPSTISRWVQSGALPGLKIGAKVYVRRQALLDMIAGHAPVNQTTGAPGAVTGDSPCPTNAPTHRTGGSISTRREAADRLDALLGRPTRGKRKR
ncbi:DNA-binding protein [Billgrantia azerbaijanica]|nr:DNA-binding protein [Halomonas azerbaijanica]